MPRRSSSRPPARTAGEWVTISSRHLRRATFNMTGNCISPFGPLAATAVSRGVRADHWGRRDSRSGTRTLRAKTGVVRIRISSPLIPPTKGNTNRSSITQDTYFMTGCCVGGETCAVHEITEPSALVFSYRSLLSECLCRSCWDQLLRHHKTRGDGSLVV
ncbi:unnamed protein product [Pylaiella littoralis]